MTKREIITKWSNIIAATWAMEEIKKRYDPPQKVTEQYNEFLLDCETNGYVDKCAEDLWEKAITYAKRLDCKNLTPLKIMRMSKGLSQSQLAKKANISVRTLQDYEQGHKPLQKANYETIARLAKTLEVDIQEIV